MKRDQIRSSKMDPVYLGPYKVVRRNKGGSYILRVPSGGPEFKAAPEQLKTVLRSDINDSVRVSAFNAERILDHRGEKTDRMYLVKWSERAEDESSWVSEILFDHKELIDAYWAEHQRRLESANPPTLNLEALAKSASSSRVGAGNTVNSTGKRANSSNRKQVNFPAESELVSQVIQPVASTVHSRAQTRSEAQGNTSQQPVLAPEASPLVQTNSVNSALSGDRPTRRSIRVTVKPRAGAPLQ